jgi:hypothetical protein
MRGGVRDQPAADQPVTPIDTDVVLITELRDRHIDHRRLAVTRPGFGGLDGPTRITILLPELGRLGLPVLRHAAFPDRLLLGLGMALLGRGDDARSTSCPAMAR